MWLCANYDRVLRSVADAAAAAAAVEVVAAVTLHVAQSTESRQTSSNMASKTSVSLAVNYIL